MDGIARRALLARARLQLVLEGRPNGADPSGLVDAALRGGADIVQLQDTELSEDDLVTAAEPIRRLCDKHGALFLLHERPQLVERCGADGVHLGRDAATIADAKRTVGAERIVGLSAGSAGELATAAGAGADYLVVGPVLGVSSTPGAEPGGLELVRRARDTVRTPWFATGGVTLDTVASIATAGAPGVAVVRALRDAADPVDAARRLLSALPSGRAVVAGPSESVRGSLPQVDFVESTLAPRSNGARPHTHRVHVDVFYVLDGELELRLGDETLRVPAGSCVGAPPALLHGFRNPGDVEARYLNIHVPGVFARGSRAGEPPAHVDTFFGTDEAAAAVRPVGSGPGDGDRIGKQHRLALVKVTLPELDVLEFAVTPEYDGAARHVHLRHADCFYVLEGTLEVRADDEVITAVAGMSVVVPPGVPHSFTSASYARFLNVHAPGCGFSEHVRALDAGGVVDDAHYDSYTIG